jgi:SAM-dependent methyltransferase
VAGVLDLCCGIGGDLLAFAAAGMAVTGVDRDELTCDVAVANAEVLGLADRVRVDCAAVEDVPLDDVPALFVDPARRGPGGRALRPDATSPPLAWVLAAMAAVPAAGAKLAPGVPHRLLPAGSEAEWVSIGGDVLECALWSGALAGPAARRATVLPAGATVAGDGRRRAPVGPVLDYLHEPDGAVIRAGLVAEVADGVGASLVDPTIAYLSTDRPVESAFLTSYRVIDVLPFGVKRLRSLLRSRGVGRVTVKKRGTAVTPEALRSQLHLRGDEEATVVLTRVAGQQSVLLVEPTGKLA